MGGKATGMGHGRESEQGCGQVAAKHPRPNEKAFHGPPQSGLCKAQGCWSSLPISQMMTLRLREVQVPQPVGLGSLWYPRALCV